MKRVIEELKQFPIKEIQLGYAGMEFFTPNQLQDGQVGYSVNQDGQSLTGSQEGDWKNSWVVIGNESCCGDPIFIDTVENSLPVYTAPHGMGAWEPELIATSLSKFIEIMKLLAIVSQGRENPVALENNPLTDEEKEKVLSQIMDQNSGIDGSFWAVFMR
jgi:hypothetical protein